MVQATRMETVNMIGMAPPSRVPPAADLVFLTKDRKVPMTLGVKEAPKGACHLHFLLSPVLTKNCRKCQPPPPLVDEYLRDPGGAHQSNLNHLTYPLSFVTQSHLLLSQTRLRSFWCTFQARPIKPRPQGKVFKLPHSHSKKAQELHAGSQTVLASLPWVTSRL